MICKAKVLIFLFSKVTVKDMDIILLDLLNAMDCDANLLRYPGKMFHCGGHVVFTRESKFSSHERL